MFLKVISTQQQNVNTLSKEQDTQVQTKLTSDAASNGTSSVDRISSHFSNYFEPIIGNSEHIQQESGRIRHQVFCEELNLFEKRSDGVETDNYDSFSQHCLIRHINTQNYAGTLRLITPSDRSQILPICKIAKNHITKHELHPDNFAPERTVEISRISIPTAFRRRKEDDHAGAAVGSIDVDTYSEIEMRCFPLISVGLYMACAAFGEITNRDHIYFMVEPILARSMRHIGIQLEQIGDKFEYVGTRAPYYINLDNFKNNLKPSFKSMMENFSHNLQQAEGYSATTR